MDGIKRIKDMAKGQKDFVLLSIVEYLVSREDMNFNYLNEEKNLKDMVTYIEGEILKSYCESMGIKDPSSKAKQINYGDKSARCLAVGFSEEKTYEFAIKYFSKSNKELGFKPPEKVKKVEEKIKEEVKNQIIEDEFGSIFGNEDNNIEEIKENEEENKEKVGVEQISFFSLVS